MLQEIKNDEALKRIPVVVLTTSKAEEDVLRTYNLHANCYVTKPVDLEKFIVVVKSIDVFWLTVVTLPPERITDTKPAMHNVLLIEDNPGDARLIREMIAEDPDAPFHVHCAERLAQRPGAALRGRRRAWCCSTCRCPTAWASRPSPRSTRIRRRCRSSCSPATTTRRSRSRR